MVDAGRGNDGEGESGGEGGEGERPDVQERVEKLVVSAKEREVLAQKEREESRVGLKARLQAGIPQ